MAIAQTADYSVISFFAVLVLYFKNPDILNPIL